MNNEMINLIEIFGNSFPEKKIQQVYQQCDQHFENTMNQLLSLQINTKESNVNGLKSEGKGYAKIETKKSKPSLVKEQQDMKPSFDKLIQNFENLLSLDELREIWQTVQRNCWGSKLSVEQHYDMAQADAENRIRIKFGDGSPGLGVAEDESSGNFSEDTVSSTTRKSVEFCSYVDLFFGLLPQETLDTIWTKAHLTSSKSDIEKESHEGVNVAILMALQYLEEKEQKKAESNCSENDLVNYLAKQELQRTRRTSSKKVSQSQRTAALNYLLDLFADSSPAVNEQLISNELITANYNISLAIENICNTALQKKSYTRGLTYAEATFAGKGTDLKPEPSNMKKSSSPVSKEELSPATGTSTITIPERKIPSRASFFYQPVYQRNQIYQEKRLNFADHFRRIFLSKNPSMFVNVTEDGELTYEGSQQDRDINARDLRNLHGQMLSIRLDFHGLPVQHATQLVESSIEYYQMTFHHNFVRSVVVTYIVGLGLHSPGGVPRLGPAIVKLLQQEYSNLKSLYYDGEISVTIPTG